MTEATVTIPRPAGDAGRQLRHAYGAFPSGVTALAALVDGRPVGLAASSFTSVSLEPALVSVCVGLTSTTWPVLARAGSIGISVLAESHAGAVRQLAAPVEDRFAGLSWRADDAGAVVLEDAGAWFTGRVHDVVPAGDHQIVLLAVEAYARDHTVAPLVFHDSTFRTLA